MASSSGANQLGEDEENVQNEEAAQISQFKEICAVEDDNIARTCLERCEWSVEIAVQEFLNEREGRPSLLNQEGLENEENQAQEAEGLRRRHPPPHFPSPPQPSLSYSGLVRRGGVHRVGVRRPSNVGWTAWVVGIVALPFRFVRSVISDLFSFVYSLLYQRRPAVTDPRGDVTSFKESYEEKYGRTHPEFFIGSYSEALEKAKKELRFLLVYLHSPSHQDTDIFCTTTLSNPGLIQFINTNTLFWAVSVRSPEGLRVSTALRESTYPFLALICLRDTKMSMVLRQEGICSAEEMIGFLAGAVQENQTYLNLARQEREQRQMDQLLREEQEMAFRESLKRDQERELKKKEAERLKEEEQQSLLIAAQQQAALQKEFEEIKERIKGELAADDDISATDAVRVSVKFPDGSRFERKFKPSDSLEELFKVCLINDNCPKNFSLVTNFPRKELNCRPIWADRFLGNGESSSGLEEEERNIPNFADAGLDKAIMVFVQDNDA